MEDRLLDKQSDCLLYFPVKQFSHRFGDGFFTAEILSFVTRKALSSAGICCVSDVVFYEIEVKRGRNTWKVYRRYTEFAALYSSLEKEDLVAVSDPSILFPSKSLYHMYLPDPAFIETRRAKLEIILDRVLIAASTRRIAIAQSPAVTSFLELGQDHFSNT
jgi:glyoxylase-like metal-dependent hydrolase (beta-lactamase superfamily II)